MREWISSLNVSADTSKLIASLLLVLIVAAIRWAVVRTVSHRVEDPEIIFRVRKAAVYVATVVTVLGVGFIWIDALGDIGTFLGLLSAGIVIALADMFLDMAGWAYIMLRRPFRIGDRVEAVGYAGDVVDIRLMRFTMLEIGNWVDADQSTGRLVHVPNGRLFREPTANYTQGFEHIWHEISVTVTFESDWRRVEEIMRGILKQHADRDGDHASADVRNAARSYFIRYTDLGPTVYVKVVESGVKLTGRILVHPRNRRTIDDEFWRLILDAFDNEPSINLAYPTYRIYRSGETQPPTDGGVNR